MSGNPPLVSTEINRTRNNRPAYNGLFNNIPTPLQQLKGYPWKEGTGDHVNVRVNGEYLQGFWKNFGIDSQTKLHTRVEKIEKRGNKWRLQSSTLRKNEKSKMTKVWDTEVSFNPILQPSLGTHEVGV